MNAGAGCGTSRRGCAGVFSVLTPPGRGGIAVVRCFGVGAPAAVAAAFRSAGGEPVRLAAFAQGRRDRRLTAAARTACFSSRDRKVAGIIPGAPDLPAVGRLAYGHFVGADGRPLDEIILYREAETVFEVNCHGGPAAVEAVCRRLAGLGLEKVDPDRLLALEGAGPIERDAERMLREARTPLAGRILLDQRNGALGRAVEEILKALAAGRAAEAAGGIDVLLARWRGCGRLLATPPRVAVAGPPNVGKSTLVNRLVGAERVITSATPGTTRDPVEADAAIEGLPVVVVDTAGLRESGEAIEREGVARARREMSAASAVVYLLDAVEGVRPEDEAALEALGGRAVAAWNKSDLADPPVRRPAGSPPRSLGACRLHRPAPRQGSGQASGAANQTALRVSAVRGDGMDALGRAILARLGYQATASGDAVPFTPAQAAALQRVRDALATGDSEAARERLESLAGGATSAGGCPATESAGTPRRRAPIRPPRKPTGP